ncbi:hypothetical protein AgCh_039477 [Apium graveolens]
MGHVIPRQGLRQGDPLSPYLFILCVEGLFALLCKYETQRLIHSIKVSRQAPIVNHLLFTDDNYLFCKANETEALRMADLLQTFEEASGQQVNLMKSSVVFSSNVGTECKEKIFQSLQRHEADDAVTYLGLPNLVVRNKSRVLGLLKEKMMQRVQGWKEKWITRAGREVLIKNLAQVVPTYAISTFLVPLEITRYFERSLSRRELAHNYHYLLWQPEALNTVGTTRWQISIFWVKEKFLKKSVGLSRNKAQSRTKADIHHKSLKDQNRSFNRGKQ